MSTIAERLSAVDTKLNNILTNANTQLTNKGKTAVSDLSDLPSAVGELKNPTGTKSITENGTVDVSNYANANVNVPTPEPNLQSKSIEITENGTTTIVPDTGYDGLSSVEVTTNVSSGGDYNTFIDGSLTYDSSYLVISLIKEVGNINLKSSTTSLFYCFSNCINLEKVGLINTTNIINMRYMFYNCHKLKTIPVFDTSRLQVAGNMFSYCNSLTDGSLDNILQMCINATSFTGTKTLKDMGLTSFDYPATKIQALPHYQDFIDAGWTIGY